jgi:hypothetical protein
MRQRAEDEVSQLKAILQEHQTGREELEQLVQQWQSVACHSQTRLLKFCDGVGKVLPVLEEMRPELLMESDMSLVVMPNQSSPFPQHQCMD